MNNQGYKATIDILGEHTLKNKDCDRITNEYIDIVDPVISVLRGLPIPNFNSFHSGFFNEEYQLRLNDLDSFSGSSLIHWAMSQTNFSLVEHLFSIQPTLLFNRKQNKMYLETDWDDKFEVGTIIIIEAYRALDPTTYTEVYNRTSIYNLITLI